MKQYLEVGDEIVADFVHFTMGENNKMKYLCVGDSSYWFDGIEVEFEKDGRAYITLPER